MTVAELREHEELEALWRKEAAGVEKWRCSGEKKLLEWRRRRSDERSSWSDEESIERRNVSSAVSIVDKSSQSFYVETQGVSPHVRGSPRMTSQQRLSLT